MNSLRALPTFVYLLASLAPAGTLLASDREPWRGEATLSYHVGSRHDVYEGWYGGYDPLHGGSASASLRRGEFGATLAVSRHSHVYEDSSDRVLIREWFDSVLVGPSWTKQRGKVRPFMRAMVGGTFSGEANKSTYRDGSKDFSTGSLRLRFSGLVGAGVDVQFADRFFLRTGVDINRIYRPDYGRHTYSRGTTTHVGLQFGLGARFGRTTR